MQRLSMILSSNTLGGSLLSEPKCNIWYPLHPSYSKTPATSMPDHPLKPNSNTEIPVRPSLLPPAVLVFLFSLFHPCSDSHLVLLQPYSNCCLPFCLPSRQWGPIHLCPQGLVQFLEHRISSVSVCWMGKGKNEYGTTGTFRWLLSTQKAKELHGRASWRALAPGTRQRTAES